MNKTLFTTLLLILIISNVYALEVNDLEGGIIAPTQTAEINNTNVQLLQKIASLENKIANISTKEDVEKQTTFIYNNLSQKFANKTDILILVFVFVELFQIGLAYSIFLYLKSQRRI